MNRTMAMPSNNPFFSVCKKCSFRGCAECHGGIKISCGQGQALVLFMSRVFGTEPFEKGYMANGKITIQTSPERADALTKEHSQVLADSITKIGLSESPVDTWSYDTLLHFAMEHEIKDPDKGGPIRGRISKTILFPLVHKFVLENGIKVEKEMPADE